MEKVFSYDIEDLEYLVDCLSFLDFHVFEGVFLRAVHLLNKVLVGHIF